MNSKKCKPHGVCQLTGEEGPFVKSHLLPRALTRLSLSGEKHIEAEIGARPIRRPESWYDDRLVTRKGEDILEGIDTPGIEELRRHRLIWSGWDEDEFVDWNEPIRSISFARPEVIQLFFLSLAWRAAASRLKAFRYVSLAPEVVEDLRVRTESNNPGSFRDFPIVLHQIVSKGHAHNRGPLLEIDEGFPGEGGAPLKVPYVRFYFDGLVAHVHVPGGLKLHERFLQVCAVGGGNAETLVFTGSFEASRSRADLAQLIRSMRQ